MNVKANSNAHTGKSVEMTANPFGEAFTVACFAAIDHLRVALDSSPDAKTRAAIVVALQSASAALDMTLAPMTTQAIAALKQPKR